jgi:hypothetical protein
MGLSQGMASATEPFMAGLGRGPTAAWRAEEKRKVDESERVAREMTESIAAAVRSAGAGGGGMGDSPPRFEELGSLTGAEMTGLETLLGL